jgi:hypothetical protein
MSGKKKGEFSGEEVIAEFERLTRDAAAVQRETLRRILDENAAAEYLRRLGLAGRTDPDAFRARVPLATHDDVEPYIARVADGGDTSAVLTARPITAVSLSSGTTRGKRKYLPFNNDLFTLTMHVYRTSFAFRNRCAHADVTHLVSLSLLPPFSLDRSRRARAGRSPSTAAARRCSSSTAAGRSRPRAASRRPPPPPTFTLPRATRRR